MSNMKCVINNNKIFLPVGFQLPENEMMIVPVWENDIRIYTAKGWRDLCDSICNIKDEKKRMLMQRLLAGSAYIISDIESEIEISEQMGLTNGEAELIVEKDVIIIKKLPECEFF